MELMAVVVDIAVEVKLIRNMLLVVSNKKWCGSAAG